MPEIKARVRRRVDQITLPETALPETAQDADPGLPARDRFAHLGAGTPGAGIANAANVTRRTKNGDTLIIGRVVPFSGKADAYVVGRDAPRKGEVHDGLTFKQIGTFVSTSEALLAVLREAPATSALPASSPVQPGATPKRPAKRTRQGKT